MMDGKTFTPGEIIAIFTGLGLLVTAIGAVIVNIIMSLKTKVKLDTIAKSVDGAATAAMEREARLRDKLELFERFMKEKDERQAKRESANLEALTQSVPATTPLPVVIENPDPVKVTEVPPKP